MESFRDHWLKKNLPEVAPMPPMFPMYGIGESVMYGGYRYAVTDFSLNEKDNCWEYDLVRLDGTDEKATGILEPGLCKSQAFAKPGSATHTDKWDRCVQHVGDHGGSANAYAVCTAMLGDDSFKSMDKSAEDFLVKVDQYIDRLGITAGIKAKSVGVGFAGPVPNSLLARQDLEGKSTGSEYDLQVSDERRQGQKDGAKYASVRKSTDVSASTEAEKGIGDSAYVCFTDHNGNEQERAFATMGDAEAFAANLKSLDYTNVRCEIKKGGVEEAKKDLIEAAEDTKGTTKTDIAANIKAAQLKTQGATISARRAAGEATGKTFKENWKGY